MNKNKLLVFLLFLFLLVFNRTALPQYNDLNKPVIYITKFRPAYESKPYSILEESLNSVLMLVLNNDYQLVVLKDSISAGYNGTSKQKVNGKWRSNIWHNKKNICLGFYNTDLEAHLTVIDYMNKNNIKRKI